MNLVPLLSLVAVPVAGGFVATWLWAKRRHTTLVVRRLEQLSQTTQSQAEPVTLVKPTRDSMGDMVGHWVDDSTFLIKFRSLVTQAGVESQGDKLLALELALIVMPSLLFLALGITQLVIWASVLILPFLPVLILKLKAYNRRRKLSEQLPDAVDLMVSVLRSGHSVSQSLLAVGNEISAPCGSEFQEILHRVSLGQPLAESILLSAQRFHSFELDLLRKAVEIQAEVGGSLAELLDNTNATLRERLKLARQLKAITAQS